MQNLSNTIDFSSNPKYQLLNYLIKECYLGDVNHSTVLADKEDYDNGGLFCPRTFDGFACWDETPAGATAVQPCPAFVIGFDPRRFAFKRCTENATWFMHPEANKPWTNYTTCVDVDDLDFRTIVNNIYVGGYSVSVAALLLSLIIFFSFRALQCTRIRIHMHLFASFALNNLLWILWYRTVVNSPEVVQDNKDWCQILHVITHYFMVSSYLWMFCEGLHLHISLVVVFIKEEVAMRWFVALGWGLSFLIVTAYATVRYHTPDATVRCWMEHSDTFWIIIVPVMISLIASFADRRPLLVISPILKTIDGRYESPIMRKLTKTLEHHLTMFLVNVVRVLLTKLHPAPNQRAAQAARKAARAALILIPLFGLHFMLMPLRPSPDSPFEKLYQIFSAILTGLQGLCVAVLFCFTNHDVVTTMRTQFSRMFRSNDVIAMTGITGGESLMNTRDNVI